jgi:hypothetical protein
VDSADIVVPQNDLMASLVVKLSDQAAVLLDSVGARQLAGDRLDRRLQQLEVVDVRPGDYHTKGPFRSLTIKLRNSSHSGTSTPQDRLKMLSSAHSGEQVTDT